MNNVRFQNNETISINYRKNGIKLPDNTSVNSEKIALV